MTKLVKPMLAVKLAAGHIDMLTYPLLASPKLDGVRMSVQGQECLSRSLKYLPNRHVQQLFSRPGLEGLDGELIVGWHTDPLVCDITRSGVMSRNGEPDVTFNVFDVVDRPRMPFFDRLQEAQKRAQTVHLDQQCVKLLFHITVGSRAELDAYEAKCLAAGYEGVMLRDPLGLHKQGRSTLIERGLMAIKRFVDAECVVADTFEQEHNTNEQTTNELGRSKRSTHKAGKVGKGTLGGFVCYSLSDCMPLHDSWDIKSGAVSFRVATGKGLTDAYRAELWAKRDTLPGMILKYRYQEVGTSDKPRIPLFVGFRDYSDM